MLLSLAANQKGLGCISKLVIFFISPIPQTVDQIRTGHITLSAQVAIYPEELIHRLFAGHNHIPPLA
jgi:hypothetical protein